MNVTKEVRKEVDELISRLSTDEQRDLLESLRKRFVREGEELRKVWGEREQVQTR